MTIPVNQQTDQKFETIDSGSFSSSYSQHKENFHHKLNLLWNIFIIQSAFYEEKYAATFQVCVDRDHEEILVISLKFLLKCQKIQSRIKNFIVLYLLWQIISIPKAFQNRNNTNWMITLIFWEGLIFLFTL